MKPLSYHLYILWKRNPHGSYTTREGRKDMLRMIARQLGEMGFKHMAHTSLKQKHIQALVKRWQAEGITVGTIKNRMSVLRWWAEQIGKPNVVLSNDSYGIGKRETSTHSKAQSLDQEKLKQINNPYIIASLKLEEAFGLRREEAIKFIPSYADQGDHIRLKASWCKGGRARTIPILTQQQREVLDFAKQIAGNGSLIPSDTNYKTQLNRYEKQTQKVGLRNMHGLRHQYAQQRYQTLTGWPCPHAGGPSRKELSEEQRQIDYQARLIISNELGHGRISIVAKYCGG